MLRSIKKIYNILENLKDRSPLLDSIFLYSRYKMSHPRFDTFLKISTILGLTESQFDTDVECLVQLYLAYTHTHWRIILFDECKVEHQSRTERICGITSFNT